jgi:hypothetical protein
MAPTWVNLFLAISSLVVWVMFIGLFFWLLQGWISPSFFWVLIAMGAAFLFLIFSWLILIALGIVATLIAGIIVQSDSGTDAGD